MSFDDGIRRFLEEQRRINRLVSDAMRVNSVQRILDAIEPLHQYRDHVSATLDQIQRDALEQQTLIDQATDVLPGQFNHYQFAEQAIRAHLDRELRLVAEPEAFPASLSPLKAIHDSIEDALRFTHDIDVQSLAGLGSQALLDKLNPLGSDLEVLADACQQVDLSEDGEEADTENSFDRANLLTGLKILDALIFDRIYKIVILWIALNSCDGVDPEQLDRVENAVAKLAENQQTVVSFQEHLEVGHELVSAITTTSVYLRTGPSQERDAILLLPAGTQVSITSERDGWSAGLAYLGEDNPIPGWISSDFLVPNPDDASQ